MQLPEIVSIIYFIVCTIYFFYGLLIRSYDAKSPMHLLFFCCCLDLSIWAFSFAIGNVAADYDSALFWRRVASIGHIHGKHGTSHYTEKGLRKATM